MVGSYVHITLRYYRTHVLAGLAYLLSLTVGMGSLMIFISSFIHAPFDIQILPFLIFSLVIFFLYGMSMDQRWYKNGLKEVELRHILGADIFDIFVQLLVESLLMISLSAIVAIVLLDISISWFPFSEKINSKSYIFDMYSIASYLLSIPAIAMVSTLIPTLSLQKRISNFRLR